MTGGLCVGVFCPRGFGPGAYVRGASGRTYDRHIVFVKFLRHLMVKTTYIEFFRRTLLCYCTS